MNKNRHTDHAKKRILVVRFSALGDVAMTLPVVYSLARQYPDVEIDFVTTPFFARLFLNPPANLTLRPVDLKKDYHGVKGTLRLLRYLSSLRPDYVADLHNVFRSWIIDRWFQLKGLKVVMVDKMRGARKAAISQKAPQPSFFSRYADVFAKLGFPVDVNFTTLFPDGLPTTTIEPEHPAVGIAPFARYANKTYPLHLVKRVAEMLTANGIHVYLFGGRGKEAEELQRLADSTPECTSLAGRFPIEEELPLMGKMDVMVSMDSANQHMASLCATLVVSIWGSTTPECGFMPYRQNPDNALCLRLDCQPCSIAGKPECPLATLACMNNLPPETVANKILSLIKQ